MTSRMCFFFKLSFLSHSTETIETFTPKLLIKNIKLNVKTNQTLNSIAETNFLNLIFCLEYSRFFLQFSKDLLIGRNKLALLALQLQII